MDSRGCVIGLQDGEPVSVRADGVTIDGESIDLPLGNLSRPFHCHRCERAVHTQRRPSGVFLQHMPGEGHEPPSIRPYATESGRHRALKEFIRDDYEDSGTWTAATEEWTDSRTRRPDVTCRPRPTGRTRRMRGVNRVLTAYEVQLAPITDFEMRRRTEDQRIDGYQASYWLESGEEPKARPPQAAALSLTENDQVVGIALSAEPFWDMRHFDNPIDLDKFTALHRRGDIVWQSSYGVIPYKVWAQHVSDGGADIDRRKVANRRRLDGVEHATVHGDDTIEEFLAISTEHHVRHEDAGPLLDRYWPAGAGHVTLLPRSPYVPRGYRRTTTGGLWYLGLEPDERATIQDRGHELVQCPRCPDVSSRRAVGMHFVLAHNFSSSDAPFSGMA